MSGSLLVALLLVAPAETASAPAAPAAGTRVTPMRVTGRALAEVYVDAGQAHGLSRGQRLVIVTEGATTAELEVVRAEPGRSVCRVLSLVRPVSVGDVVTRPVPSPRTPPPAPATPVATAGAVAVAKAAVAKAAVAKAAVPPTAKPPADTRSPTPSAPKSDATAQRADATAQKTPAVAADTPSPAHSTSATALAAGDGKAFSVRYRSASNVYLDGGRAQGLNVGDKLQAMAGKTPFADLEVLYVAEQSASCRLISETRPVKAGDSVVRVGRATAPAAVPAAATASAGSSSAPAASRPSGVPPAAATPAVSDATPGRAAGAPWARIRGSASVGYYQSSDNTGTGLGFNERTARLDLTLSEIDGRPLSFTLRGRSRQDVRDRRLSDWTPEKERSDRLYEVALRYEPPSDRFGFEAGRIGLYRFVGIGYLDGALARYRPTRALNVGVFGGRAAEIEGLGFNGTGAKYGAFLQLAPGGRYSTSGYDALLAFVRENADGDVSRQYLSLESRFSGGGRWSVFERAEVDLNSGWRQEATGKSLQLSNVSLSGNLRLASTAWAFVSYDGRRNYRYYLNRLVPEEVFDDLLHQGLRAGLNYSKPGGFGATAGFGMSLKEPDPRHPELNVANAYSFNGGLRHASLFGLSVGIDGSGFSNGYADGAVVSARAGHRFRAGHLLDLSYGRSFYRVTATEEDRSTQWLRLNGRFELGRHAYLSGDFEYDKGDDLEGPRGLLEAGWIF
jgi:hypothetical protein